MNAGCHLVSVELSKILVEAGEENAGLVDIGDGQACVFKIREKICEV